jgi:hypothetical protein
VVAHHVGGRRSADERVTDGLDEVPLSGARALSMMGSKQDLPDWQSGIALELLLKGQGGTGERETRVVVKRVHQALLRPDLVAQEKVQSLDVGLGGCRGVGGERKPVLVEVSQRAATGTWFMMARLSTSGVGAKPG